MKKTFTTRNLILLALFASISIILSRFLYTYIPFAGFNSIRISLGNIPIMLSGLLLGPLAGAVTGAVADIIGASMFAGLGINPGFTLTAAMVGVIPALLKPLILKKTSFPRILLILFISEVITSMFMNTLWLSLMSGTNFWILFVPRAVATCIMAVVYAFITYVLYRRLSREFR